MANPFRACSSVCGRCLQAFGKPVSRLFERLRPLFAGIIADQSDGMSDMAI
jgi:hypothetical protein